MSLMHIGLTINKEEDINDFYIDLLGFEKQKEFLILKNYSNKIFNLNQEIPVVLLLGHGLSLELFLIDDEQKKLYNHICIDVRNRKELIKKTQKRKYKVCIIKREDKSDLVFIEDGSGNKFEIIENNL